MKIDSKLSNLILIPFCLLLLWNQMIYALDVPPPATNAYELKKDPNHPRGIIIPQTVSFLLPGFDQYWEGQYPYAVAYTGTGLLGYAIGWDAQKRKGSDISVAGDTREQREKENAENFNFDTIGLSLYQTAGSLSAYHSFRAAVKSRPQDFTFIKEEDQPRDLLLSPFQFSFLKKPTTFLPLLTLSSFLAYDYATVKKKNRHHSLGDGLQLTGGFSYMAGVGEEALFRGWLLPVTHYSLGSAGWANALNSLVFGLAHYSKENKFPLVQTLVGAHLGYVTQQNGYSLQESIFIHTWWDVLAIGYLLMAKKHGRDITFHKNLFSLSF